MKGSLREAQFIAHHEPFLVDFYVPIAGIQLTYTNDRKGQVCRHSDWMRLRTFRIQCWNPLPMY
jgi:hypothetical protein